MHILLSSVTFDRKEQQSLAKMKKLQLKKLWLKTRKQKMLKLVRRSLKKVMMICTDGVNIQVKYKISIVQDQDQMLTLVSIS